MSQRYECYDADSTDIEIVPPGTEIGEDDADDHTLIIGNPWSAALALFGGLDGIEHFAYRVLTTTKKTRARLDAEQTPAARPDVDPAERWQTGDIVLAADRQLWCRADEADAAEGWPWAYVHSYAPRQHADHLPEGAVDEHTPARPLALLLRDGRPTIQTAPDDDPSTRPLTP
ncbi:hypothetical protein [Actinoplanes sp. NPDC051851]|uniref:hypothetical protein n=1 Tax=Actinoplanes sp. NPDC051851 TaxID=3154753 RepID=UPI00343281D1